MALFTFTFLMGVFAAQIFREVLILTGSKILVNGIVSASSTYRNTVNPHCFLLFLLKHSCLRASQVA